MDPEREGRTEAVRFRQANHLGTQPLGDLITIVEQTTGIDVAVLDTGPDEHGLTMRDPATETVFIGVARTRHPMRQRSTLAHELGHVLFEDWGVWSSDDSGGETGRSPGEVRADAFARHLLLPIEGLGELVKRPGAVNQTVLSNVVQRFMVSPAIAAIALRQAGWIDYTTKQAWMGLTAPQLAARFGWIDLYRALQEESDRRRPPQRLLARAIRGYVEGVVSAQTIATLRGTPLDVAEADLREAGVRPVEAVPVWADLDELPGVRVDLDALDADLARVDNDVPGQTARERE
ncbi:ImmA/IrrE family metallo-endopeptidase [Actinokineospora spheciospongiae]|uniref:ImmA/IrrE family metallo-endopeptidase n=1 Tax=Actinokineospora spheciospongiae TaxID=909613 RepID=UPI000D71A220|nr:ImmA/IrrE family metallo-endopeptidase [Actinokineospora spheciospongiae]PWW62454.1 uncharacterized protein DUF955 [Actinokineospora spheciospongiae]